MNRIQHPGNGAWSLEEGIRGRHLRRSRYDDPLWEREDFDVIFQDQENKLIYYHDADTSKITGPFYRKWLYFPQIQ